MKYLDSYFQELYDKLIAEFGEINFLYKYDESENQHYIFHDRSDIEFNEKMISIVMGFLKKNFYEKKIRNISFGYGYVEKKTIMQTYSYWANQIINVEQSENCIIEKSIVHKVEHIKGYLSNNNNEEKMSKSNLKVDCKHFSLAA